MKDIEEQNRTARFVCALAIYFPGRKTKTVRGTCEGRIARKPQGENGFGYDPLFYLPEIEKSMAQLEKSEKNEISHQRFKTIIRTMGP